jgi:hypothetical protein
MVRVELAEPWIDPLDNVAVIPEGRVKPRETLPVKPFTTVIDMTEAFVPPGLIVRLEGVETIVKSGIGAVTDSNSQALVTGLLFASPE